MHNREPLCRLVPVSPEVGEQTFRTFRTVMGTHALTELVHMPQVSLYTMVVGAFLVEWKALGENIFS